MFGITEWISLPRVLLSPDHLFGLAVQCLTSGHLCSEAVAAAAAAAAAAVSITPTISVQDGGVMVNAK